MAPVTHVRDLRRSSWLHLAQPQPLGIEQWMEEVYLYLSASLTAFQINKKIAGVNTPEPRHQALIQQVSHRMLTDNPARYPRTHFALLQVQPKCRKHLDSRAASLLPYAHRLSAPALSLAVGAQHTQQRRGEAEASRTSPFLWEVGANIHKARPPGPVADGSEESASPTTHRQALSIPCPLVLGFPQRLP